MSRTFYVYIRASRSRALYTGVTNDPRRRLGEHRKGAPGSFTARYRIDRLVDYETTHDIRAAIAREKEIKDWTREMRIRLIEERNAGWLDLGAAWSSSNSS